MTWYRDPDVLYAEWARDGYNARAVGRRLGVHHTTVNDWIVKLGLSKPVDADDLNEIIVKGGNGLVAGDLHIPVTDFALADREMKRAKQIGCTDWFIAPGDFINSDAWSRHEGRQGDAGARRERDAAKRFIDKLYNVFDRIVISAGNHDVRLMRKLEGSVGFNDSMRMFLDDDKVEWSGLDYVLHTHENSEHPWRFCHTAQYARNQLTVPNDLAMKYHQNVIGWHRHHHAMGWSRCGHYRIGEGGCWADGERTKYLKEWSTTFPRWQPGHYFFIEGQPWSPMLSPVAIQSKVSATSRGKR